MLHLYRNLFLSIIERARNHHRDKNKQIHRLICTCCCWHLHAKYRIDHRYHLPNGNHVVHGSKLNHRPWRVTAALLSHLHRDLHLRSQLQYYLLQHLQRSGGGGGQLLLACGHHHLHYRLGLYHHHHLLHLLLLLLLLD